MEKITSRRNAVFLHAKYLGKNRGYRHERGEFLCDGSKLLVEAIKSGIEITGIFAIKPPEINLPPGARAFLMDVEMLRSLSPLKNPQDVLFTCRMPQPCSIDYNSGTHILLDTVQDPGNVGTIIRSADAFGFGSVILTGECADPYNPKSIRASMGAIFRQKVIYADIGSLQSSGAKFIGADNDVSYTKLNNAQLDNCIIALGSEGQGLSFDVRALCGEFIAIPVSDCCESLNVAVAASIIMWEASTANNHCVKLKSMGGYKKC